MQHLSSKKWFSSKTRIPLIPKSLISKTDIVLLTNNVLSTLGLPIIVFSMKFNMGHCGKGKQSNSIDPIWTFYFQNAVSYSDEITNLIPFYVVMEQSKVF